MAGCGGAGTGGCRTKDELVVGKNKFCYHCFYGRLAAMRRERGRAVEGKEGKRKRERGERQDKTRRKLHFVVVLCVKFRVLHLLLLVLHEPLPDLVPSGSSPSWQPHFKRITLFLSVSRRIAPQRRTMQFLTNPLSVLRHPIMNLSSPLMY